MLLRTSGENTVRILQCDKGVKGRRMLLCRVELCDRDECIKADFKDLYKERCSLLSKPARGTQRFCVRELES